MTLKMIRYMAIAIIICIVCTCLLFHNKTAEFNTKPHNAILVNGTIKEK